MSHDLKSTFSIARLCLVLQGAIQLQFIHQGTEQVRRVMDEMQMQATVESSLQPMLKTASWMNQPIKEVIQSICPTHIPHRQRVLILVARDGSKASPDFIVLLKLVLSLLPVAVVPIPY